MSKSKQKAKTISAKTENIEEVMPVVENTQNWIETSSKLLGTLAMVLAVQWFSGPYTAIAAREIYTNLAEKLYGSYSWYDPRYYTLHIPSREHVSHLGYEYGPYILNTLLAPLIYKGVGKLWYLGKKAMHAFLGHETPHPNDAQRHELEVALGHIISQMENLSMQDNTTQSIPATHLSFKSQTAPASTPFNPPTQQESAIKPMRAPQR